MGSKKNVLLREGRSDEAGKGSYLHYHEGQGTQGGPGCSLDGGWTLTSGELHEK